MAEYSTVYLKALIAKEDRILLIKHKETRHWGFPGGKLRGNVAPLEVLQRKVKLQTGLDIIAAEEFAELACIRSDVKVRFHTVATITPVPICPGADAERVAYIPLCRVPGYFTQVTMRAWPSKLREYLRTPIETNINGR